MRILGLYISREHPREQVVDEIVDAYRIGYAEAQRDAGRRPEQRRLRLVKSG